MHTSQRTLSRSVLVAASAWATVAFAILAGASALAAEAEGPRGAPLPPYVEAPDDPPAAEAARDNPLARSPGRRVQVGPYVSVQVNVDELGQNITGDAANEPSIAIDPLDPQRIVIGWRQFDTVASNFRQGGWGYSHDGGQTWTFPGVLEPGVFRSDPVLDSDNLGRIHFDSLKSNFLMDFFTSLDGGVSWGEPVPAFGGDKNWAVVDKSGGMGDGHAYGTWQSNFGCCGSRTFTRSTDGAASFETPVEIPGRPSFGAMAVGPDGELYAAGIDSVPFQDSGTIAVGKSTNAQDAGATPTFTTVEFDLGGSVIIGGAPNPEGLLGQVWVAVDTSDRETRGHVYVLASVDPTGTDPMDVQFARSTDGGATWSESVRVNDDPVGNGAWQWFGTLSAAPVNGRLDVVWNDTRNGGGDASLSETFYAYSHDGWATWSANVPFTPVWDSHVGWPNQNKIGDYYHMVSDRAGASLAYATTLNGEQDVYFVRLFPDCNGNGSSDVDDILGGASGDADGDDIPDECEGGLLLALPDPGLAGADNTFTASGAAPGATITFLRSQTPGTSTVPGCPDLTIDMASPTVLGRAVADAEGTATFTRFIPGNFQGRTLLLQALDRAACAKSNLVTHTFQ